MADTERVFVAAAFCPAPPLLHPAVAGPAGGDVGAQLRAACAQALTRMLSSAPEAVLVLGPADPPTLATSVQLAAMPRAASDVTGNGAPTTATYGAGDAGDLFGYGVPVRIGFDGPPRVGSANLPLAHTLAAWLLDEAEWTGPRLGVSVSRDASQLRAAGTDERRWGLVVMGDGSARRSEKSPGWYHRDALAFDERVGAALASGDGQALLDLDPAVGDDVLASGLTSWRAAGEALTGISMSGTLHYAEAPYGVFYAVATWVRTGEGGSQ